MTAEPLEREVISRFLCKRVIFNLVTRLLLQPYWRPGLIYGFAADFGLLHRVRMDTLALMRNHQRPHHQACLPKRRHFSVKFHVCVS